MSYWTFKLFLFLFACPNTFQQALPPKAVNAERIKLLKDALSSMTFKKDGQLATDQDLEPFFEILKDNYLNSRSYKTLVIAFSRGVLPKLTLKENDPCNPAYTLEYRDKLNNSVTDGQLKKFIISSHDKRGDGNRKFCNYLAGLVCNQNTSKCECPPGSKMESISQGETRCLGQPNEICNLIDLDHDPSSDYTTLKRYLPEMVFNLEKPMSCKMGTQCRFTLSDQITPRCYPVNSGSWDKGRWDIDFGEECTLGLYGDTGQCRVQPPGYPPGVLKVNFDGYTCFNFGPRSKPKSPRVGICAHDSGSYSIAQFRDGVFSNLYYDLEMIGFVSPATTPLRGKRLHDYYLEYKEKLMTKLSIIGNYGDATSIARYNGSKCHVENSEKVLELWKFFKSLEETPPSGKDYLATEAELDAKIKEAEALTADLKKKICRYRSELHFDEPPDYALKCVGTGHTDYNGNNGKCEYIPESEDVTLEWAKKFYEYRVHVGTTDRDQLFHEKYYRKDIYEPELECDPDLGPPPGSPGAAPSTDSDVLEGGYCPPDRGCYKEYNWDIYNPRDCSLKDPSLKLWRICQDLNDNRQYVRCEDEYLNKLFGEELQTVASNGGLQRGDACQHNIEVKVRRGQCNTLIQRKGTKMPSHKLQANFYS